MELIEKLVKLDTLYLKELDRRGVIKLKFHSQLWQPLTLKNPNCSVSTSAEYLKKQIDKNSKIDYLKEEIAKLQEEINNSPIKDLRFWTGKDFKDEERTLSHIALKRMLFMNSCLMSIKELHEETGLAESTIKQACQQERLLNTSKIGKTWLVHYPEACTYWDLPGLKGLYKDWEY